MDGNIGAPKNDKVDATKAQTVGSLVAAASSGRLKLPLVPRVVTNLIVQLKAANVSVNDIVNELEQDPMLAARVLRMANSPFFCGYRSVSSVSEAVVIVGTEALRTLIISCGISGAFVEVPGANLRLFWAGSTLTAHAARELARLSGDDMNSAFLAGLLHRTGHLILCMSHHEAAGAFADVPYHCGPEQFEQLELEHFGLTHRQVGAAWLDSLGLPMDVVKSVRDYIDPPQASSDRQTLVLRLATQIAAAIAADADVDALRTRLDADAVACLGLVDAIGSNRFASLHGRLIAGESS